jgi:hypothetical protein
MQAGRPEGRVRWAGRSCAAERTSYDHAMSEPGGLRRLMTERLDLCPVDQADLEALTL